MSLRAADTPEPSPAQIEAMRGSADAVLREWHRAYTPHHDCDCWTTTEGVLRWAIMVALAAAEERGRRGGACRYCLSGMLKAAEAERDARVRERDEARTVAGWRQGDEYDRADYKQRAEKAEAERDGALRGKAIMSDCARAWDAEARARTSERDRLAREHAALRAAIEELRDRAESWHRRDDENLPEYALRMTQALYFICQTAQRALDAADAALTPKPEEGPRG